MFTQCFISEIDLASVTRFQSYNSQANTYRWKIETLKKDISNLLSIFCCRCIKCIFLESRKSRPAMSSQRDAFGAVQGFVRFSSGFRCSISSLHTDILSLFW